MIVTEEWLFEHTNTRGSLSRRQAEALGIEYPLRRGWRDGVIGQSITDEAVERFIAGRRVRRSRGPDLPPSSAVPVVVPPPMEKIAGICMDRRRVDHGPWVYQIGGPG